METKFKKNNFRRGRRLQTHVICKRNAEFWIHTKPGVDPMIPMEIWYLLFSCWKSQDWTLGNFSITCTTQCHLFDVMQRNKWNSADFFSNGEIQALKIAGSIFINNGVQLELSVVDGWCDLVIQALQCAFSSDVLASVWICFKGILREWKNKPPKALISFQFKKANAGKNKSDSIFFSVDSGCTSNAKNHSNCQGVFPLVWGRAPFHHVGILRRLVVCRLHRIPLRSEQASGESRRCTGLLDNRQDERCVLDADSGSRFFSVQEIFNHKRISQRDGDSVAEMIVAKMLSLFGRILGILPQTVSKHFAGVLGTCGGGFRLLTQNCPNHKHCDWSTTRGGFGGF